MKEDTPPNKNEDTKPPQDQYDIMRSGFNEVLRLAKIGAKAQLKGLKPSNHKDQLIKNSMGAIAFVNSFLSGVDKEYEEEK